MCPGDDIIDASLFTYQTHVSVEVQATTPKPKTEPEEPKTTKTPVAIEKTKKNEEPKENEDEKIPEDYIEPNEEPEEKVIGEIEKSPTTTTITAVTTTTMPSEMPDTTVTTHRHRGLNLYLRFLAETKDLCLRKST